MGEGKHHELRIDDSVQVSDSIQPSMTRGLDGIRLAVLGIIVGIGLSAASLFEPLPWWSQAVIGIGTVIITCFAFWHSRTRHLLMDAMHRLTGV